MSKSVMHSASKFTTETLKNGSRVPLIQHKVSRKKVLYPKRAGVESDELLRLPILSDFQEYVEI